MLNFDIFETEYMRNDNFHFINDRKPKLYGPSPEIKLPNFLKQYACVRKY